MNLDKKCKWIDGGIDNQDGQMDGWWMNGWMDRLVIYGLMNEQNG